jgi:ATP-dependent RNA helicase RhlB
VVKYCHAEANGHFGRLNVRPCTRPIPVCVARGCIANFCLAVNPTIHFPIKTVCFLPYMEFTELSLHPDLQRGITEAGYTVCTPVQAQVLTSALNGNDLYVQSQTGTGKTAAFLVVIFQRLLSDPLLQGKKALIMVPTRELATQVEEEANLLGAYLPYRAGSFYGGIGYSEQQRLLKEQVAVMVGTPGRVLDLNHSGLMNLMDVAFLVLDEADRMFDMGFYPDLRRLLSVVPPVESRQTMLFSATLSTYVKNLAWEYTTGPVEISIEPETVTVEEVEQLLYHVHSENKMKLLLGILQHEQPESTVIFCNTKRYTEIIAGRLRENGYPAEFISGDLPQSKRLAIIDDVKSGTIKYLVATDVAARGLDIEGLALVVNYDLPAETANYVHRIGRTARAGRTGKAISLASEQDVYELADIERYIEKKIPSIIADESHYGEIKGEQRKRSARPERSEHSVRPERRKEDTPAKQLAARRETRTAPKTGRSSPRTSGRQQADTLDLSKMSFEERMVYYRQKYDPDGQKLPLRQKKPGDAPRRKRSRRSAPDQPVSDTVKLSDPASVEIPAPEKRITSAPPTVKLVEKMEKTEKAVPAPAPVVTEPKKGMISRMLEKWEKFRTKK